RCFNTPLPYHLPYHLMKEEYLMRRPQFFVLFIVLLLLLAACGGSAPPAADEAAEAPPAAEAGAETEVGESEATSATAGKEAPILASRVAAGELPPLEERIPVEPLIIDLPWTEVGQYGGVMKRTTTSSDFEDTSQYMYGHSP